MPFYSTEECATFIKDLIWDNRASLTPVGGDELKAAYPADQKLIPTFPSVIVVPDTVERELVATGMQVALMLNVQIYVMHAKLTKTKTRRTQEDIQMARNIVTLLHQNRTMDNNVIVGVVFREDPGRLSTPQGQAVVGTRLSWRAEQREHIWAS